MSISANIAREVVERGADVGVALHNEPGRPPDGGARRAATTESAPEGAYRKGVADARLYYKLAVGQVGAAASSRTESVAVSGHGCALSDEEIPIAL